MIALIDNENYMIRVCENEEHIHGFHPSYPNWKGLAKMLSDKGDLVVLSGKEAEDWLDEEGIYYVHIEKKAKENFERFKARMYRTIKENEEYINSSLSFGKLIFARTKEGRKGTIDSLNCVEVWRMNEDNRFYVAYDLPDGYTHSDYALIVRAIAAEFADEVGVDADARLGLTDILSHNLNLFSADSLTGLYARMCALASLFAGNDIEIEEPEDEDCCDCDDCDCDCYDEDGEDYDDEDYDEDVEEDEDNSNIDKAAQALKDFLEIVKELLKD